MTTDDVKRVANGFHEKRKYWPSKSELAAALLAEGLLVEDVCFEELLEMLQQAGEVCWQ